jgi:hypothetical protein
MAEKNTSEEKVPEKESKEENKILKVILITGGIILVAAIVWLVFSPKQNSLEYKGINFTVEKIGNLTFYDTTTLANNSQGAPFGFRIRTNPNDLKNVPFENSGNFNFTRFNFVKTEGNYTFDCNGYGIIAIVNLQRTFSEMGMSLSQDQNATCDPQGRYGLFNLRYGNKTEIEQVGSNCYDIIMRGNDSSCDVLPATEKLMVDAYAKYLNSSA